MSWGTLVGMCGRYADFGSNADLASYFGIDIGEDAREHLPSWNVAPSHQVRLISDGVLHLARWGLIPVWAKSPTVGAKMINARAETLAERPAFRVPLAKHRVIVPASGYYEWQSRPEGPKQPMYIHPADDAPLAFAGLLSWWREREGSGWIPSIAIVTREAEGAIAQIHHRVPVALDAEGRTAWAGRDHDADGALKALHRPLVPLSWRPVGRAVNSPAHNNPSLIRRTQEDEAPPQESEPLLPGSDATRGRAV